MSAKTKRKGREGDSSSGSGLQPEAAAQAQSPETSSGRTRGELARRVVPFVRLLISLLALNAGLYFIKFLAHQVPPERIQARVLRAYASGDLKNADWPLLDSALGSDQFSDCAFLASLMTRSPSALQDITGNPFPKSVFAQDRKITLGQMLNRFANGDVPIRSDVMFLPRYWEMQDALAALLLYAFDLPYVRLILKAATYLAIAFLGFSAISASRRTFLYLLPVIIYAFFFSGVPFLGQSIVHAPGFILSFLTAAALLTAGPRWATYRRAMPVLFLAGNLGEAFDQLSGGMLLSACLAFWILASVGREHFPSGGPWYRPFVFALTGVGAYGAGAVTALVAHQFVFMMVAKDSQTLHSLTGALDYRMTGGGIQWSDVANALVNRGCYALTYGSTELAMGLIYFSSALWLVAGFLFAVSLSRRFIDRLADFRFGFLASLGSALGVFVWYAIFRSHTAMHAWFMGRYLFVPLAFAWIPFLYLIPRPAERRAASS